jgi:hypothetical protein
MDVNGNGTVGTAQLGVVGSVLGLGSTDAGDSVLSAEVAAARQFLARLDARRARVALVTFAGEDLGDGNFEVASKDSALTEVGLTHEYRDVEKALCACCTAGRVVSGTWPPASIRRRSSCSACAAPTRRRIRRATSSSSSSPTASR